MVFLRRGRCKAQTEFFRHFFTGSFFPVRSFQCPESVCMGVGKHHNNIVPVRHHGPGRVDGLSPAGHKSSVHGQHQRRFAGRVIALWHIFIPFVFYSVCQHLMKLHKPFRVGLGIVTVFIYHDIRTLYLLRQVFPVVIVRRSRSYIHT